MLNHKNIPQNLYILVALAVVLLGAFAFASSQSNGYSVVSTVNGQFFVGRLSHVPFSRFIKLSDAFLLQNTQGADQKVVSQLIDLSVESYWQPKAIYLNIENIILQGDVNPTSPIATQIAEYKAQQANTAPTPAPQPQAQ